MEGQAVNQFFLVREVENHHQRPLLFNFSVALPSNAEQLLCREEQHNCLPGTDRCLKQFHARVKKNNAGAAANFKTAITLLYTFSSEYLLFT